MYSPIARSSQHPFVVTVDKANDQVNKEVRNKHLVHNSKEQKDTWHDEICHDHENQNPSIYHKSTCRSSPPLFLLPPDAVFHTTTAETAETLRFLQSMHQMSRGQRSHTEHGEPAPSEEVQLKKEKNEESNELRGLILEGDQKTKKTKKRRITKIGRTPTYGGFRHSELDTVANSARRIFLCKGVVQGLSKSGACARQCVNQKKAK